MQRNLLLSMVTFEMPLVITPARPRVRARVLRFDLPARHAGHRAHAPTNLKHSRQQIEVK